MITITCNFCDESMTTRDVQKAIAFDREHRASCTAAPTGRTADE